MGLDYSKVVVEPTVQVAPLPFLRGFEDDFGSLDQEVVLLVGETHLDRKPVSFLSGPQILTSLMKFLG